MNIKILNPKSYLLNQNLLLIVILFIGAFLRFYKLDWGDGLFTHPDEYHIAISVNQLSFPNQMHPHFFSYGTVSIYLIYFTRELLSLFFNLLNIPNIPNPFLIGRFYSALFSTLTIFIVYKISQTFLPQKGALLAAFLVASTAGLIQQAHFATPESTMIFFLLGSLLFLIYFTQSKKISQLILSSIFLGLALGVKVSSLVFAPIILLGIILSTTHKTHVRGRLARLIPLISLSLLTALLTFFVTNPYVFLDFPAFKGNLDYESGLAAGRFPVFYTRQFINTPQIIFQLEKILPFALGPALMILGLVGFISMGYSTLKSYFLSRKPSPPLACLLIITSFSLLFLTNSFLFAKWTRFISPTFPLFAIFTAFFFNQLKFLRLLKFLKLPLLILLLIWPLAFFSIYLRPDIRITTSKWLEKNASPYSTFLVERGNTIDLPLKGNFTKISLDFYSLEDNFQTVTQVSRALESSDYFLIESRRVFLNHQRLPLQFPKTARFYQSLFDGELGFTQTKEFHSFPGLSLGKYTLEFPDENAEETLSVFDHPVIRVFKKTKPLTAERYLQILDISPKQI